MVKGIGIDTCSLARIAEAQAKFGHRLAERLLTPTELAQKAWDAPALARRWAIKEAVAKALGTGIGAALSFQDIEITSSPQGAPQCAVQGREGRLHISVTDDAGLATAIAIWEAS
jgi:holo-[acyl-carrier protein] synthase